MSPKLDSIKLYLKDTKHLQDLIDEMKEQEKLVGTLTK